MTLSERLAQLMGERGINRAELSKGAGVPYTTIVALFEKGTDNIKLSTMRKLAAYFGITLDDLADGGGEQTVPPEIELSDEEILTLAAHQVGHTGPLTPEQMSQIKLAVKIALAKEEK